MRARLQFIACLALVIGVPAAFGQTAEGSTNDAIARIRDEGLNRSEVMKTLSYLTDVIGPRLTGSPNLRRANEWTRDRLQSWGLEESHLEPWGPFGRGWSLKRFSAQIIEPQAIPLIGFPNAWSPGFPKPLEAEVIHLEATNEAGFEKYRGKLAGAAVLISPVRALNARFEPLAIRYQDTNLLRMANAAPPRAGQTGARNDRSGRLASARMAFLQKEGVAVAVSASGRGDGGTLFVQEATTPSDPPKGTNPPPTPVRVFATNAPLYPAQITLADEHYNRLVRMLRQGEKLRMSVDLQTQFHTNDLMAWNTIAEIPGTDLKDEVVMLGAHLDSWHAATGATDNGAGVSVVMEAVRILKALKLEPRRTIRIALWTGEEHGLLGSKAYVSKHFGYRTNIAGAEEPGSPRSRSRESARSRATSTNREPAQKLIQHKAYDRLSAYYNLDNGTGKIRGVYMQGNEAVRPLFRQWLARLADLGAETLTPSNTFGTTDHLSFDAIGVPGFQFIQDPLEYNSRTHHSNQDFYDRIQPDDLKQASVVVAVFVYNTAMHETKLPRKP